MFRAVAKLAALLTNRYKAIRYGDVYQNWDELMRLVQVTDSDEADPTKRKKKVIANAFLTLWIAFTVFRMSLSPFWITGIDHIMGQTMNKSGNVSKLFVLLAGVSQLQSILYRLVCIRLTLSGDMIFMRTLKSMVSWHHSGEDDPPASREASPNSDRDTESERSRAQKDRIARIALGGALLGSLTMVTSLNAMMTGLLWLNIRASETAFQVFCWLFWYAQDVIMCTIVPLDIIIFPSMWFVLTLNYRTNLKSLSQKIAQLIRLKGMGSQRTPVPLIKQIRVEYISLAKEALRVNTMSSQILFATVLCTTPLVCMCMFVAIYSDNAFLAFAVPVAGGVSCLFECSLLAMAANITSESEKMHRVLCSAGARQCFASLLSLQERQFLLLMMEHASTESESFALTMVDGQKYTEESFVSYVIETGLQYTLLVTFNQGIIVK